MKEQIVFKTRKEQSDYADSICIDSIKDVEFLKSQMDSINPSDTSLFDTFNTTSVGNLAFLSINAPKEYAEKAEAILKNYTLHIKTQINAKKNHS